jgi:hypothetical protein
MITNNAPVFIIDVPQSLPDIYSQDHFINGQGELLRRNRDEPGPKSVAPHWTNQLVVI